MIVGVLDTNVLASGFAHPGSIPDALIRAWLALSWTLVISEHVIVELERTFEKPYFRRLVAPARVPRIISLLRRRAVLVPLTVEVRGVASHTEDDPILATALSGRADYLITGDHALQDLGTYQGVTIVSPREFLDILRAQATAD